MYPDFIGIGAQKAGTTWLYRNMRAHPEIWMPKEKELHYFDEKITLMGGPLARIRGNEIADQRWKRQANARLKRLPKTSPKGMSWKDLSWDLRYFLMHPNDNWYSSLFEQGKGKITGETTPDYSILDEDRIAYVYELMPDAKIIFMVRNPIERPWSVMDMDLRMRSQDYREIPDATVYPSLDNKRIRLMTNYTRTIENWSAFYPEDQIFVGFLEDIHFFPEELLRRVYEFLGASTFAKYRVIRRRIHSGKQSTMPTRFASYLAGVYQGQIQVMGKQLGGYADFWLYCAAKLIEAPPEDENIPYPLWESSIWKEWRETHEIKPRSGTLSSLRDAR